MTAILGLLTSRIGALVSAGLAVMLLLAVIVLKVQIHDRDVTITGLTGLARSLQADLATSRLNAATLEAGVERQNAAIQAQAAAGAAQVARLDQVASQARQDAQTAQQRAAAILARPRTGNVCADADSAILEAIR